MRTLAKFFLATLFVCSLTTLSQADTLTVTSGTAIVSNIIGGPFSLTTDVFTISGSLNFGPSVCSPCLAGQTVNVRTNNVGDDVRSGPSTVNGTFYQRLFYERASLLFESTFVVPNITSPNPFSIAMPFTFNGSLLACTTSTASSRCPASNVVFTSDLIGQGTATVTLSSILQPTGRLYFLRSVNYNFGAEPVPEPATVLLFVSGMIGVGAVVARKRRKTN